MTSTAFVFALAAGVSVATYTIFLRLASPDIHPILGATIITGVAFLLNLLLALTVSVSGSPLGSTTQSVYLVIVVGVAAACADLFTLSAYARGLKVTSSFIIGGTSTLLVLVVGFALLREPFSWTKLAAIGLILSGIFLLQREGM